MSLDGNRHLLALAVWPRLPTGVGHVPRGSGRSTSALKTHVGGSRACASGRSSRRARPSLPTATGCRRYAYKTALGRSSWPNRDPLEEAAGANVYAFVGNDPVARLDFLGLQSCSRRCGPDVTLAVQSTLQDIEQTFGNWSIPQRVNACRSLYLPTSTASGAWMMLELGNLGFGTFSFPSPPAVRGDQSVGCGETVKYGGRCFFAGDVHYLMWGKVNSLCYQSLNGLSRAINPLGGSLWTLDMALAAVDYWKTSHHDAEQYRLGARLFTTIGYSGYYGAMPSVGAPIEYKDCNTEGSSKCGLSKLTWRWYPYRLLPEETAAK